MQLVKWLPGKPLFEWASFKLECDRWTAESLLPTHAGRP